MKASNPTEGTAHPGRHKLLASSILIILLLGANSVRSETCTQTLDTGGRTLIQLLFDPVRPVLYGLCRGATSTNAGEVLVLDRITHSTQTITIGLEPIEMALDPEANWLYVLHVGDASLSRINTTNRSLDSTRTLPIAPAPGSRFNLAVGRSNVVYVGDAAWSPLLHIYDYEAGAERAVMDVAGVGDLLNNRDGTSLFIYRLNNGSGAAWVSRWNVANATNPIATDSSNQNFPNTLPKDPTDAPLLISTNEAQIWTRYYSIMATNLTNIATLSSEVWWNVTPDGRFASSETKVYNATSGAFVLSKPFSTRVSAVSPDGTEWYLFNPSNKTIQIRPWGDDVFMANPGRMNLAANEGCPSSAYSLTIETQATTPWTVAASESLSVLPASGTGTATLQVVRASGDLSPGLYLGVVTVITALCSAEVPVDLVISTNPNLAYTAQQALHPDWVNRLSQPASAVLTTIRPLNNGDLLLAGQLMTSTGNVPVLIRQRSDATAIWSKALDLTPLFTGLVADVAIDAATNLIALVSLHTPTGGDDIRVIKLDGQGQLQWHYTYNGSAASTDIPLRVFCGPDQSIWVAGRTRQPDSLYALFFKLSPEGSNEWTTLVGNPNAPADTTLRQVVADDLGNLFALLQFPSGGSPGGSRLARISAGGTASWTVDRNMVYFSALTLDLATNLLVTDGSWLEKHSGLTGDFLWNKQMTYPPYGNISLQAPTLLTLVNGSALLAGSWVNSKYRPCMVNFSNGGTQQWAVIIGLDDYFSGHRYGTGAQQDAQGAIFFSTSYGVYKYSPFGAKLGQVVSDLGASPCLAMSPSGATYQAADIEVCSGQRALFVMRFQPNNASDFDEDGLPNTWEAAYAGNPWDLQPTTDQDGDGFTTWQEYLADSQPTNATSVPPAFRGNIENGVAEFWLDASSTARVYGLQVCTNLAASPQEWIPTGTTTPGNGASLRLNAMGTADTAIYQSTTSLP